MINWIIGGVIFGAALLIIIRKLIKAYKGEGCCACSECSTCENKCNMQNKRIIRDVPSMEIASLIMVKKQKIDRGLDNGGV